MRTALNLPDVAIDQINRGDVITDSDLGGTSSTLTAQVERSPRLRIKEPAARPLKNGSSVYLHHGTSRVDVKVALLEKGELEPGQKTIAHLKIASPIFAFVGDRFVVRDASEKHTMPGGGALDRDGADFLDAAQVKLSARPESAPDVW